MRSRPLARNVILNLAGQVAPALTALVALPLLAASLTPDRLGILTLAWTLVGTFSFFDLGLGRALTQVVAARMAVREEADRTVHLIESAHALLAALGVCGGLAVVIAAPWLTERLLRVPPELVGETRLALYWLALAVPATTISSGSRGVLEARQRFDLVNLVRAPQGVLTFLGPVCVLPFSSSVVPLIAVLALVRVIGCWVSWIMCARSGPPLRLLMRPRLAILAPILRTGAWLTAANIAGAMLLAADRLVLGARASLSAVAFYATPQEFLLKLAIVPMAFSGVAFAAFSAAAAVPGGRVGSLFTKTTGYIFVALFPITFALAAFAPEILAVWLGPVFATRSAAVAQWFCFGVLVNAVATVPFGLLQAVGRANLTFWLYFVELPLYGAALWYLTDAFGIEGAAVAWAGRITLDALLMFVFSRRLVSESAVSRRVMVLTGLSLACFGALLATRPLGWRGAIFAAGSVVFAALLPVLIEREDRVWLIGAWRQAFRRA